MLVSSLWVICRSMIAGAFAALLEQLDGILAFGH
jgi:hypothetical protein